MLSFCICLYNAIPPAVSAAIAAIAIPTGPVSVVITAPNPPTAAVAPVAAAAVPAAAAAVPPNNPIKDDKPNDIWPTINNSGPIAAAIPARAIITFCAPGDSSPKAPIISLSLCIKGVITGSKTSPISVERFLISVTSALIEPDAPSASLAACPCAAPVCSIIRAKVAACLVARSISPLPE